MQKIKNVLFVCFGNSARSPLAHGIAQWLKREKYKEELKDVNFYSAGFVNVFNRAQDETIEYLKKKGIDFSDFKGTIMDDDLLIKQDLILVMETRHLKRLNRKFKHLPQIIDKAYLLLKYAEINGDHEIEDPVNKSDEEYYKIAQIIEKGVIKAIEKIIKINNQVLLK
ncbi:MAG: hypothetical protein ACP6IY_04585 [Promethearchaeia archaeon]